MPRDKDLYVCLRPGSAHAPSEEVAQQARALDGARHDQGRRCIEEHSWEAAPEDESGSGAERGPELAEPTPPVARHEARRRRIEVVLGEHARGPRTESRGVAARDGTLLLGEGEGLALGLLDAVDAE